MNTQIPPHDAEAEAAVLGSVLKDPDTMGVVAQSLTPEAFYLSANRTIYQAMLALWETRKPANERILESLLRSRRRLDEVGGLAYLRDLQTQTEMPFYIEHYAEIVNEKAQRREQIDGAAELVRNAYDESTPLQFDGITRASRDRIGAFSNAAADIPTIGEIMDRRRERAMRKWAGEIVDDVYPTGITTLDTMLGGGLRRRQMFVLAGRTSMGKSAMAQHWVRTKVPAIYVTLEMPSDMVGDRMISTEAAVPFSVSTSVLGDVLQRDQWLQASKRIEDWPITVVDSQHATTTDQIRAITERYVAERGVRVVYIDHLTELLDSFRHNSEQEKVGELARRCKRLADQCDVAVVLLAQLNREAEGRTGFVPYMSDLRSSGQIEEVADAVALVYRRGYYSGRGMLDKSQELDYLGNTGLEKAQVILAKNRNGPTGTLSLGWDPTPMRFYEEWERSAA